MSKEEFNLLVQADRFGGWHRKPITWDEVGNNIPQDFLEKLPQYTAAELGIGLRISNTFTRTPESTLFLVGHNGGLYLVRTEGADYVRYIRYVGREIPGKPATTRWEPGEDTTEFVLETLEKSGYPQKATAESTDRIYLTYFMRLNDKGQEVHRVFFTSNEDHEIVDNGYVYIWNDVKTGELRADF